MISKRTKDNHTVWQFTVYHHKALAASDLRKIALLMQQTADRCINDAIILENEKAKLEQNKDEYLP